MSECLSYKHIVDDIKNFKKSGTSYVSGNGDFNMFDTPSHKFFKLLFYFGSNPEYYSESDSGSGLLAPTWEIYKKNNGTDYYNHNSAWAYLKLNDEEERAEKLEQFVTLLSDISTYSPWYFSALGGLDAAIERKSVDEGKLEMPTDRKLTITCLPDAYDNRIGTLLDLYRDITWSWIQKKEIIPANLRKFDMAVYIFESPVNNMHDTSKETADIIGSENNDSYKVSYKMLEFHDCEINYNSAKSGWSEMTNETGISPKYTIEIGYSDCYEISYNEIMMRKIGDVILTDMLNRTDEKAYESKPQYDEMTQSYELKKRSDPEIGFIGSALNQVAGHLAKDIKSLFSRAVLGNIHTASLTQIGTQLSEAAKGNLIKTGMTVAQYIKTGKNNSYKPGKAIGNIFNKDTVANNL